MLYKTRYYTISTLAILMLLCSLNFNHLGIVAYIDLPTIVFVIISLVLSRFLDEKAQNSFLVGVGLFLISLSFIAIYSIVEDMTQLGGAIAVGILPMVYLSVYIFYVSNIKQILSSDSVAYKAEAFTLSRNEYIFHLGFVLLIFVSIVISGAGFRAVIDVPSLLVFLPLLATIKFDDKIKGLLLRQNLVLGAVTINFFISIYSVLLDSSSENIGPSLALMTISSTYALYLYLSWIKPQLSKTTLNYTKSEYMLYIVSSLSLFLPFVYIVLSK